MSDFKPFSILVTLVAFVFCSVGLQADSPPYAIEEWAKRSDINSVQLSPDGNKLAFLKIPTDDGMPILEIFNANDLSEKPFRMDAKPMEMTSFQWATDNTIIFTAKLKVRDKIDGWNQGVYDAKGGLLTLAKRASKKKPKWKSINDLDSIRSTLPTKPNKVLIAVRLKTGTRKDSPKDLFYTYFEYDIETGRRLKVATGSGPSGRVGVTSFDINGEPRFGSKYDGPSNSFEQYYRKKGGAEWEFIHSRHRDDFEDWFPVGFDPETPGNLLVIANNGNNTTGLWSFNPETRELEEHIYQRTDVDIGVAYHSNRYTNGEEIVAISYTDGRDTKYEWFNGEEKALYDQLKTLIPYADKMRIPSRSRDGKSFIVANAGPRDPGTYYLFKDGVLQVVGSRGPQFSGERLADVEVINYKARDGKDIKGYITVPNSEPPYPLIVMPHGGPFVSDERVGYDFWGQMFANRGYMVLQPQYRGTRGLGLDFYTTAFINGGQGGYQMQDDKDDGALYLADKGLVDRDRMMMYGWSYGGYAALVAASRTPQIYQCVIAGASVPDPNDQISYYRNRMAQFPDRGSIEQVSMWDDSIQPIKEVAKVNVPMLVIHGDVDQRTPPRAARAYIKALEDNKKEHKVVWLEGADHFYNTWYYGHMVKMYTAMFDFLDNDCFDDKQSVAAK
jgi:dipeptidyl aminopeptidase/acylaminoacyl peptidase